MVCIETELAGAATSTVFQFSKHSPDGFVIKSYDILTPLWIAFSL